MANLNQVAAAVTELAAGHGPGRLRSLADRIEQGWPPEALTAAVPVPGFSSAAAAVLAAQQRDGVPAAELAAYLRGVAAGYEQRAATVQVETVWSGPSSHAVPVRATAQVLTDVVAGARAELVLMTYSARPYPPLIDALTAATGRGVQLSVVVETLQGAGSAMSGPEPSAAFQSVPGVQLWHWPVVRRDSTSAKMHAKVAIADRSSLLVSSANLTQSGVSANLEAGLLLRGGTAPARVAEHIAELMANGTLARLGSGLSGEG